MSRRAGGGSSAADSGSKTQVKGNAKIVNPSMPLERILQISVVQHTPRMTFDFVKSVVPDVGILKPSGSMTKSQLQR